MKERVLIAMSGGVDSSAAALLMKQEGYDCIGVTMKLYDNGDIGVSRAHTCCSLEDVEDARGAAAKLQMPHYVYNFIDRFREDVIDRFIDAYQNGRTPNPCIDCNRYLKFDELFRRAEDLDCQYVVTGHYARTGRDETTGRYYLRKGVDPAKDQSYVLYSLTQEQLARVRFPLGGYEKTETRRMAARAGLENAGKHDSQDICFVPDGDYASFIQRYTGHPSTPGNFIDREGHILGVHRGIEHYTLGQRKGLGLALQKPAYVCEIRPGDNTVVLGSSEDLMTTTLRASDINLITVDRIEEPMRVMARVRYHQQEKPATVIQTGPDTMELTFDEPQRAVTPGQAVVMYNGSDVVGGGTILP